MRKILILVILFQILVAATLAAARKPTIISLSPYVTESLYDLGAEDHIIGITSYCNKPSKKTLKKEKIGSMLVPNIEKILYLKPDIIIATKEDQDKETIEKMKKFGLKVVVLKETKGFTDICDNFKILAGLVDKEKKARKILKSVGSRLKKARKLASKQVSFKDVFICLSTYPLFTVSGRTFLDDAIHYAGGRNIVDDNRKRYPIYSIEELVLQDPDIIISLADNFDKKFWGKYSDLNAVKNNKIFQLNPDDASRATPLAFVRTVEQIYEIIKN